MQNLVPVVIVLFLLAAVLRIDFYFHIVYLLAGVYVLSRLWTHQGLRQLEADRRLVNRAFPGEDIPVTLTVRNAGWLPIPWVEVHDSLPVEMISPPFYREAITLTGHETRRFHYTLTGYKRGYYPIGPLWVHVGDMMDAAPTRSRQTQREYIIVYPRVVTLEKLGLPTHSPLASLPAPAPLFEDPTRVMGVREYQVGDSPRRIHWTASASAGQLLVKRYQPAIARETLVCLDLDRDSYQGKRFRDASELAVITAASLANHITHRERLAVGLVTQADDPLTEETARFSLAPRRERAHLMSIFETLARVQLTSDAPIPFAELLRQESVALSWGSTIVVITGRERAGLFDMLAYLRRTGFAVALILVMPPPSDGTLPGRAQLLGIPVYHVWQEEDLEAL